MPPITTPPPAIQETFRVRAKVAMARRDLTVTEVASRVGVSRVTASEAINHELHQPTRRKIAALLGISL